MTEDFSELLRAYRKNMGWTQTELAEKWSYSFETISSWERRKRIPSNQEIPRLAKLFEMNSENLKEIIENSREQMNGGANRKVGISSKSKATWKSSFETWGEVQSIYRTRTEFNKAFSYPRMFENAQSILAAGFSLNAISQNYDRELIQQAILENDCFVQLCYLDPQGKRCAEREDEEGFTRGVLASYTKTNLIVVNDLRNRIIKINKMKQYGAYLNKAPIQVSNIGTLNKSIVHFGDFTKADDPQASSEGLRNFSQLVTKVQRIRMIGTAATDLAYVACGRADALVNSSTHLWDIEAGKLLVQEAGGQVTTLQHGNSKPLTIYSNNFIHQAMKELLNK